MFKNFNDPDEVKLQLYFAKCIHKIKVVIYSCDNLERLEVAKNWAININSNKDLKIEDYIYHWCNDVQNKILRKNETIHA